MNSISAFSALPTWMVLLLLFPVAAYALMVACNVCGADPPSYRKSLLVSTVASLAAFLTFDGLGYGLVLATRDMTHLIPPATYLQWLTEPMYLKWQAMGLVPVLRYLPVAFAVCLAGVLYVLMLRDEFRIVMVVFLFQWVLTVLITSVLAFALSNILAFVWPHDSAPSAQPAAAPTQPPSPTPTRQRTRPSQVRQKPAAPPSPDPVQQRQEGQQVSLQQVLTSYHARLAPTLENVHQQLDEFHQTVDPYLEPIKEAAAPYTRHLPLVVQEFLDDGGWFWVLLAIGFSGTLGLFSSYKRMTRAFRRKRRRKQKLIRTVAIDLDEVAGGLNEPGDNQVTVRGFPGRLRLVIMSPASSYVGDLLPEMGESLLDWIRPGLGEVYEKDCPRVLVWPRMSSEGRFCSMVAEAIKIPEERGRKTPWIILTGTTSLGRQRIYLCVGVFLDRPGYIREILVEKDGWSNLLALQPSDKD